MALIAKPNVFNGLNFNINETQIPFSSFSVIRKRFGDSSHRNVVLRSNGNASVLPKIRAQNLPGSISFPIAMFIYIHTQILLLNL
jgi:hypothetical protein